MSSKIIKQNVADSCEEYMKIFGANKNLYRMNPSLIDGLKPGNRRLLYTMDKIGCRSTFKKVDSITGQVLEYHPHGTSPIYDTLVSNAQPWNNNICIIEGDGNFGSVEGDPAGAGRYIKAKLSDYSIKCFFEDFADSNVDMKVSYTGTSMEPEFLPAKYPNLLVNGSLGIGYGLASNIPPYNFKEVIDATIKLIKNPKATICLVPDSPTGAYVVDKGEFQQITNTGSGKYTMRGVLKIDEIQNTVTIIAIPFRTTLGKIVDNILELRESGTLSAIIDVKNYTNDENGVRYWMKLRQDTNPYDFVELLYKKKTGLEETYPVQFVIIDNYTQYEFGIKTFLLEWIEYRRDIKRSSFNFRLVKAKEDEHINDILLFILNKDNAEKTVGIIKAAANKKEAVESLMDEYGITSLQAGSIADMRLSAFTKEVYEDYKQRRIQLKETIKYFEKVIDDNDEIDKIIISELEDGAKRFGEERRSQIINLAKKKAIKETSHVVAISRDGYCKKLPDEIEKVGKVGKDNDSFMAIHINNKDTLLVFDRTGRVSKVSVSSIPDSSVDEIGISLKRFFTIENEIVSILKEPDKDMQKNDNKELYLVFVTKYGFIKKTLLNEFYKIKDYKSCMTLDEGDELVSVAYAFDKTSKDLLVYTSNGNGTRLDINKIKSYGRKSKGLRHVQLTDGEVVVGASKMEPRKKCLLYLTSQGKAKITETKYLPEMARKEDTVNLVSLDDGDTLVGIMSVHRDEKVILYKKLSEPQILDLKEIDVSTRMSKAKKMIKLPKGDYIVSFKVIV